MKVYTIHHVSLTSSNLERSKQFYRDVLTLDEIIRPDFPFPRAWFRVGEHQQLHLIVSGDATFRGAKGIDTRDIHFAVRVASYRQALEFLRSKGYREEVAGNDPMQMKANPRGTAGFPQIYILDPDRHVIEINAEQLD